MDEKQVAPPGQVQIKADEKELQGLYSNLVMIQHHAEEFTLNFVYIFPNGTQGKLLSSVIVSPGHAKRIWRALGENISRFEAAYGPIKEGPEGAPVPGANIGFEQKRARTQETRVRFQAATDQALLDYLGEESGAAAHERVLRLLRLLQSEPIEWIRNIQPAYCSLLITFDATVVDHAEVQAKLSEYEPRAKKMPLRK